MQCGKCGHVYEQVVGKVVGAVAVPVLASIFGKRAFRTAAAKQAVGAGGALLGGMLGHWIDTTVACPRCGSTEGNHSA